MFQEYPDIVSVPEVMEMLHLSKNTVYELIHSNSIKTVKARKRFIITKQNVINFVNGDSEQQAS